MHTRTPAGNPSPSSSGRCPARVPAPLRTGRFLLLAILGLLSFSPARADTSKEYQLKAAFLYNFTKFVEWPAPHVPQAASPIVIAVLGDNPFGDELENAVRGRLVNGRPIVVKIVDSPDEAGAAQVLFVGANEERRLGDSLDALHRASVLTVGETRRFAAMGGIITFTLTADKVRFEINQDAGEQAGLKINAQLLKLATPVRKNS